MPYVIKAAYTSHNGKHFDMHDEVETLREVWPIVVHLARDGVKDEDITIFAPNGDVVTQRQALEEVIGRKLP
jgi:hypothetical protein